MMSEQIENQPSQPRQSIPVSWHLPAQKAYVTFTLIGLSVLVYILQIVSQLVYGSDIPLLLGAKINQYILAGEVWRFFTPMLLHGSILHIGFNMYALYVIGQGLEKQYGHAHFLLLYVLTGFCGNVASFIFSSAASLGASTAIFGLVAAEGVFIYKNQKLFGDQARKMLMNTVLIVVVNLMLGLSPGIDNFAHLGGLISGVAFTWFAGPVWELRSDISGHHLENTVPNPRFYLAAAVVFLVFVIIAAFGWR
ncbi:MAG: rhomboid family intramembrane serine protease [Anaerolineaceae bacterium]